MFRVTAFSSAKKGITHYPFPTMLSIIAKRGRSSPVCTLARYETLFAAFSEPARLPSPRDSGPVYVPMLGSPSSVCSWLHGPSASASRAPDRPCRRCRRPRARRQREQGGGSEHANTRILCPHLTSSFLTCHAKVQRDSSSGLVR